LPLLYSVRVCVIAMLPQAPIFRGQRSPVTVLLFCWMSSMVMMSAASAQQIFTANNPNFYFQGRFLPDSDSQTVAFDWSSSSVSFGIANTSSVALLLSDPGQNWFKIFVDGNHLLDFPSGDYSQSGLVIPFPWSPTQQYQVLLFKRTEAFDSSDATVFYGIQADTGAVLHLPAAMPRRRLLFFGDSLTAGYAVLGNASSDCSQSMTTLEDSYYDYSNDVALNLGAALQVVAISGHGVVRNYGDPSPTSSCPNCPMPFYFNRTIATSTAGIPYAYANFVPDAIVSNLGTNDFSTPPNPSQEEFVNGYLALVAQFRAAYPLAPLFLVCGPAIADPCCTYVQEVVQKTPNAFYISMVNLLPDPSLWSCGHPTVKGQQIMAAVAAPFIAQTLGW
jgi:lysophospholipase L1-like esterase